MFGVVALVVVILGVVALVTGWMSESARLARALRDAPRATVAELREGVAARLVGTVGAQETLSAPLTGRVCVAYVVLVEERISTGKSSRWVDRIREIKGVTFSLDDGTGKAMVDAGRAKLLVEMDSTSRSGTFDDATPVEAAFLSRHGMNSQGWFFNKTLRYTEGVIEPGERVAVMGRGVREPDPDAARQVTGYRDALPTRVWLSGTAEQPMILTDKADLTR